MQNSGEQKSRQPVRRKSSFSPNALGEIGSQSGVHKKKYFLEA
jgi:hypothetical protein